MTRIKGLFCAGLISVACGQSAFAADLYDMPTTFDWTGLYGGIQGGWAGADMSAENLELFTTTNFDINGGMAGGHIGYLHQFDQFVAGLEGDFEWWGMSGDDGDLGGVVDGIDGNWLASLRGRVGLVQDHWLFYATGGLQVADFDVEQSSTNPTGSTSINFTEFGWTAGGGIEYAISDSMRAGVEYRYIDISDQVTADRNTVSIEKGYRIEDFHTVRARLSWKF
jgi:outer membrane immunogenic protein